LLWAIDGNLLDAPTPFLFECVWEDGWIPNCVAVSEYDIGAGVRDDEMNPVRELGVASRADRKNGRFETVRVFAWRRCGRCGEVA
jgi:hypothetical protein